MATEAGCSVSFTEHWPAFVSLRRLSFDHIDRRDSPVDCHVCHAMIVNKGSSNDQDMEDLKNRVLCNDLSKIQLLSFPGNDNW